MIGNNRSPNNGGGKARNQANKSFENLRPPKHVRQQNLLELQHPTKSFNTKKGKNAGSTLSTSPKRRDGSNSAGNNYSKKHSKKTGGGCSSGFGETIISITNNGPSGKKGGSSQHQSRSDLHLFIEAFEKDYMSAQANGAPVATPKQILRKVEEQMRAFGLDPKSGNNQATAQALALKFAAQHSGSATTDQVQTSSGGDEGKRRKKSLPPKLKLLGLTQTYHHDAAAALFPVATSNQNVTPSNLSSNGSGAGVYPFGMARSQMNIANSSNGKKQKGVTVTADGASWQQYTTRNRSSGSTTRNNGGRKKSQRDRSAESRNSRGRTKSGQLSTGRGASSGSGGRQPH